MRFFKIVLSVVFIFSISLFSSACAKEIQFDYNIEFVVDGEVVQTIGTNGDKISMPKDPVKENYTFGGWYWDEGEWLEEFTIGSILDQPLQEKNTFKVYAKWDANEDYRYVVAFDGNGAKGTMTNQDIYVDEEIKLKPCSFTYKYSTFDCWNTKKDGSGQKYLNEEKVCNLAEQGKTVTLYAQWKTQENVVYIDSAEDFETVKKTYTQAKIYVLANDIDFKGQKVTPLSDGDVENGLVGTFDGNGHIIKNFTMEQGVFDLTKTAPSTGFFGNITNNGCVKNVGLEAFTITGSHIASFAYCVMGKIENCYANGTLNATDYNGAMPECFVGGFSVSGLEAKNNYFAGSINVLSSTSFRVGGFCDSPDLLKGCLSLCYVNVVYTGNLWDINDFTSFGYFYSNPYVSNRLTNCYYYDGLAFSFSNNGVDCTVSSPLENCLSCTAEQLNGKEFYLNTLGWQEDVWDLSIVDVSAKKYPKLKID